MNIALLIAGGVGNRMGQDIPKQFLVVEDKPIIVYTLEAFQKDPNIDEIAVVCLDGWQSYLQSYANQFNITKLKQIIPGGNSGHESIRNGVMALAENHDENDIVLIHDAIRPMVSTDIIDNCIATTIKYGNAIVCIPCCEVMLSVENKNSTSSTSNYDRDRLKRTQTPQAFHLKDLVTVHNKAKELGIEGVASASLFVEMGYEVHICPGSEKNIKITTPDDIEIFKALLHAQNASWMK